jgi:hypothetical protein
MRRPCTSAIGYGAAPYDPTRLINTSSGAYLTAGGDWTNSSDRNLKENFAPVDGDELLAKIAALDITEWNYRADDATVRHIGPVAQDFHALFGLGHDDRSISTTDPAGIALAAIKELHRTTEELKVRTDQIQQLESEVEKLKRLVEIILNDGTVTSSVER